VLWVLIVRCWVCWGITISWGRGMVDWDMVSISWGRVTISRGRVAISRGRVTIGRLWVGISWLRVSISRFNWRVCGWVSVGKLGCIGQRDKGEN